MASPEEKIRGVAKVLEDAAAEGTGAQAKLDERKSTEAESRWSAAMNAECQRRDARVAALPAPRTLGSIAAHIERRMFVSGFGRPALTKPRPARY